LVQSDQILGIDQSTGAEIFCKVQHAPDLLKLNAISNSSWKSAALTRVLFAVANLLVGIICRLMIGQMSHPLSKTAVKRIQAYDRSGKNLNFFFKELLNTKTEIRNPVPWPRFVLY